MNEPSLNETNLEARLADALAAARSDSRLRVQPWADGPERIVRASRRRRMHRASASLTMVAVLVLATVGGSYAYIGHELHAVQTSALALPPGVHKTSGKGALTAKPPAGQPFTVLILGTDSREGTGTEYGTDADACHCSDTIILARVDPQTDKVSLLSVPRDSRVTIANTGKAAKLNSAYAGGVDNSVATIEKSLQIPINHWIVLDLAGFKSIVDATHGLKLDFPYPIRDKNAGLDVTATGCQSVNGDEALAISRSRELQYFANGRWTYDPTWENGRQRREQILMRVIAAHTVKSSLSNPLTANAVVRTFTSGNRLAVDSQVTTTELINLASDFAGFDASTMQTFSLPTVTTPIYVDGVGKQDFEVLQPTQDVNTIQAWYDAVRPAAKPSATPASPATKAAAVPPPVQPPAAQPPAAKAPTAQAPAAPASPAGTAATTVAPNQPAPFDPIPCSS